MPADPLDKQLVEAVLSRPRRAKADLEEAKLAGLRPSRAEAGVAVADDDDDDDDDDDLDLGPEAAGERRRRRRSRRRRGRRRRARRQAAGRRAAKLDPKEVEEPTAEELEAISRRHDRDRRPGPDVPQGDRQGRLLTAEEEVVLAKAIELGEQMVEEPWKAHRLAPRVDAPRHRAQDADARSRSTACRSATRRTRWSRDAISAEAARRTCSSPTPDFHLVKAGRDAQSDGHQGARSRRPRSSSHAYNETPTPDDVPAAARLGVPVAVHNGDLDSRDNVGLRAIYDWTRDDVAFPALERWIMAGNDADLLKRMGYDPEVPLNTKLRDRKGDDRPHRPRRARAADLGQPAAGRVDREEVHRPRHVVPGPHPGRQHRPHPGGREVRLREGLQVLARTPRGGSARPSPGPSPTRRGRSASRSTWSRRSTG